MARHRRERGSAMIEFAIAASALLFVLLAIMEFGQAMYVYNLVTNDARLGARYAMVRGSMCSYSGCPATKDTIQTYVRSVSPNIDATQLNVTTTWPGIPADSCTTTNNAPGCLVTVTASYPFQSFGPFRTMSISSTSQMYISR